MGVPVFARMLQVFVLSVLVAAAPATGSDIEREKRLANQVADVIFDGEVVYLDSGDNRFLNIYTETEAGPPKGAAIVLHGRGYHPDWENVARPLRIGLAEAGWNTLSMQMPVLAKDAKYYDYVPILPEAFPRIEAGIDYLKQQGNRRIVLIAHSCSVHMVMAWIDAGRSRDIDAYVGIGMGATDYRQPMAKPFPLDCIKVPVLDVYGGDEYPAVIRSAPQRLQLIEKAGNEKSKQIMVPRADHYFTDRGDALLEVVNRWLDTL